MALKRIVEIAESKKEKFIGEHEVIIGEVLKNIYEKYIPDTLPDWKRVERQISLVIGIACAQTHQFLLYQTYEEIVSVVPKEYACAGAGQEIAYYFLDRLFRDERPPAFTCRIPKISEATTLMQFVMKQAKDSVGGVGGNTKTMTVDTTTRFVGSGSFGAGWESRQPQLHDIINYFWLPSPTPAPTKLKPSVSRKSKQVK